MARLSPEDIRIVLLAAARARGRTDWMQRVLASEHADILSPGVDITEPQSSERETVVALQRALTQRLRQPSDDLIHAVMTIANAALEGKSPFPQSEPALVGTTADGVEVRVEGHQHYPTARVWVDGVERKVLSAWRLRDGGTTFYICEDGKLTMPHRIGSDDRTPRWEPKAVSDAMRERL